MTDRSSRIALLRSLLTPEAMAARLDAARSREQLLLEVARKTSELGSQRAARDSVCPGEPIGALNRDLRLWREFGLDGLIDARRPPTTNNVPRSAQPLAVALADAHPEWSAVQIRDHMADQGIACSERVVRHWLKLADRARPRGARPAKPATIASTPSDGPVQVPTEASIPATSEPPKEAEVAVYRHPFAGAELLYAVGVVRNGIPWLAELLSGHAEGLTVPDEIDDDRSHRDRLGRFLPSYNTPQGRRYAEVGAKFESVRHRRLRRDPRRMKLAQVTEKVIARKLRALVMLPIAVAHDLRELDHGSYRGFGRLTGFPYRANTLDKFMRELKYAEAGGVLAQGWSILLKREGEVIDAATGAALVFGDATTHALNTALYTRSLLVASKHKVMPGMSTVTLTNGVGSIVQYSVSSGSTPIRDHLPSLLDRYEATFGPGKANRVLVVDREGHSRSFFQEIGERWQFIIALCSNVTGTNAVFEDLTAWTVRPEGGEVRDGRLLLKGRRKADSMWVRVVGLRRHPEGRTMWFATNTPASPFTPREVVRIYFQRWPCQELRFRDGKGRVGLDRQYGYGKSLPDKVALLQRTDVLDAELSELDDLLGDAKADLRWLDEQNHADGRTLHRAQADEQAAVAAVAEAATGPVEALRAAAAELTRTRAQATEARANHAARAQQREKRARQAGRIETDVQKRREERDNLAKKGSAFAVDHELDEVMVLPRALFLHACAALQRDLLDTRFETDTLIRRVLQLPGELHVGAGYRRVVIYRNPDDREATAAIERAVKKLSASPQGLSITIADPPGDRIR